MHKGLNTVAACLLFGSLAFGIGNVVAKPEKGPKDPSVPWILSDGSIDRSQLPACFQVLGADGTPRLDARGQPLCVSSDYFYDSPPEGVVQGQGHSKVKRKDILQDGTEYNEIEVLPFEP